VAVLTRPSAFTVLTAALLDQYADEIERIATAVFGSTANTARPRFLVRRTSTQAVANTTDTLVIFQDPVSNPRGMWDAGAPTLVTVQSGDAGDWLLVAQNRWLANATGSRAGKILNNGNDTNLNALSTAKLPGQGDGEGTSPGLVALARLAVGDTLRLSVWQSSGSSQSIQTSNGGTFLGGLWMGP